MKTYWQLLLTLGLVLVPSWAAAQPARARFANSERRSAPVILTWNVELEREHREWRSSREAARKAVLGKAQQRLAEWLRERYPYSSLVPSEDFIDKHIAKEGIQVKEEEEIEGERLYSARVKLTVTPEVQRMLFTKVEQDAAQTINREAWQRQYLLGKGLLFLIALAATAAGYFHLDDRSQGFYTRPLRLAALAVLAVAGYGIALLP